MTTAETMQPALTPEQWRAWFTINEEPEFLGYGVYTLSEQPDVTTHELRRYAGDVIVASDGWHNEEVTLDRHQTAALALYGQPFGFTGEDVASIRAVLEMAYEAFGGNMTGTNADPDVQRVRIVADKLAALLPPE